MQKYTNNTVTLETAINNGFTLSEYQQRDLNKELKELESFNKFCKVVPTISFEEYEGKTYLEHLRVLIEYKGYILKPYKKWNGKSFEFFLVDSCKKSVSHNLIKPNNIGVATEKKLNDWLNYLIEENNLCIAAENEAKKLKENYLKKLEQLPKDIKTYVNGNIGTVYAKNFTLNFEICDTFVSERITYTGANNFETFLKLI